MKIKEKSKKYIVAVLSFSMMVSIAAFINYRYNPEREKDLGQTVYVSTNVDENSLSKEAENESLNNENMDEITNNSSGILYENNVETVDIITKFKTDRDNRYLELSNNYYTVINNSNSSSETISSYQGKLADLIEEKNNLSILESIIISKGVDDAVVIVNTTGKVNVVVKTEELLNDTATQIMQSVIDQLGVEAKDISIEQI